MTKIEMHKDALPAVVMLARMKNAYDSHGTVPGGNTAWIKVHDRGHDAEREIADYVRKNFPGRGTRSYKIERFKRYLESKGDSWEFYCKRNRSKR